MKTDVSEDEMGSDLMIIWSSDFSNFTIFLFVLLLWSGDGVFLYFLNTPLTTHDNHFVNIKESASHPISATPFVAECPR